MERSRYKGVDRLRGGRWGARITVDGKRIWLGSHNSEDEAAVAYDRVNLKLHRYHFLNFPHRINAQEFEFQGCYSLEQIIAMVRNKSYADMFATFLSVQAFLAELRMNVGHGVIQQEVDGDNNGPAEEAPGGLRIFVQLVRADAVKNLGIEPLISNRSYASMFCSEMGLLFTFG
ncbi:hypothetical protein Ancab_033293 [Ancistrocladus abbreviatus]